MKKVIRNLTRAEYKNDPLKARKFVRQKLQLAIRQRQKEYYKWKTEQEFKERSLRLLWENIK